MMKTIKRAIGVALATALVALALSAPALAADRLQVQNSGNSVVFNVDDAGTITTSTSSKFVFDSATGRMGIGTGATAPGYPLDVVSTGVALSARRDNTDTVNQRTGFQVANNDLTANNGISFSLTTKDSSGATLAAAVFGAQFTSHTSGSAAADIVFKVVNQTLNAAPVEALRIKSQGNVVAGNGGTSASGALATTATNGFLYIPTVAGQLTSCATASAYTGHVPVWFDSTNNMVCTCNGTARKCTAAMN